MTAREFLESYLQAQHDADLLREKYDALRESYDGTGGSQFTESHSTGISKPTERKVEKAQRALEAWREAELDALEIRQNIFDVIIDLPMKLSDVLYYRYLQGYIWTEVCDIMGLSNTQAHKKHNDALRAVQEILDQQSA